MIIAVELSSALAAAVEAEAARHGQTASAWIADRLSDRFGTSAADRRP